MQQIVWIVRLVLRRMISARKHSESEEFEYETFSTAMKSKSTLCTSHIGNWRHILNTCNQISIFIRLGGWGSGGGGELMAHYSLSEAEKQG